MIFLQHSANGHWTRDGPKTAMLAASVMIAACGDRQAENLDIEVSAFAEVPLVIQVEGTCEDVALESYCWKQLKDPTGCYFRTADTDFKLGSVAWSGKCRDGLAEGRGALEYITDYEYPYRPTEEGMMAGGRKHDNWIENSPWGRVTEVTYANGKRNEKWLVRNTAGIALWEVQYVDDKRNGPYVVHAEDGTLLVESSYLDDRLHGDYVRYSALDGSLLANGAYAAGKREGQWIESYAEFILKGAYANGERDGEWVVRHKDGAILAKGSYRNDELQGDWTFRYGDGSSSQGAYLGGQRVGVWTVSDPDGGASQLNYARRPEGKVVDSVALIVRVEGRCGDLPLGFPCWKELENSSGCYSWSAGLAPRTYLSLSRLTWTGECSNGIAEGEGTLTVESPARWTSEALWRLSEGYQASVRRTAVAIPNVFPTNSGLESYRERTVTRTYKGSLVAGRRSGEWREAGSSRRGHVDHYVNGLRTRTVTKNRRGVVTYEMNYVDGEANGVYAMRSEDGTLLRTGIYVDREEEGHWIEPSFAPPGLTMEGVFTNGLRNGEWTVSDKTGHVISRGSFLNDEPHGDWTFRYRNGFTAQGAFEHSERIGAWTVRDPEGNVTTVRYEGGEQ